MVMPIAGIAIINDRNAVQGPVHVVHVVSALCFRIDPLHADAGGTVPDCQQVQQKWKSLGAVAVGVLPTANL